MNIVFLAHPGFSVSQSMPRYANWLMNGMIERGHTVELWQPQPNAYNLPVPKKLKKWMSYIDQYIIFPNEIRQRIEQLPKDFLFVLTDHALGPWVPIVVNRPHIIHCHDFLAQLSALGEIKENPTTWTGRQYQTFIRKGYTKGKNFISISKATQNDLHRLIKDTPTVSEIVYNGLLDTFTVVADVDCLNNELQGKISVDLSNGYLLQVGGNQWYKNRTGAIDIYNAWQNTSTIKLPLLMVGPTPSEVIRHRRAQSPFKDNIHFLSGLPDKLVQKLYSCASAFLFPSLAEGFGWPIIEAMASGCPVITTNAEPMMEVAGGAAFLIPRLPQDEHKRSAWAIEAAKAVTRILDLSPGERSKVIAIGKANVQRFNSSLLLDKIEKVYQTVVENTY